MTTLPPLTPDTVLRDVQVLDHRLTLWETGDRDRMGRSYLAYRLTTPEGEAIFEGDDYRVGFTTCIDSDAAVRGILNFLTLSPGDVDEDYFRGYTQRQVEWRDEHAETLSMYALDPMEEELAIGTFNDWPKEQGGMTAY